MIQRSVFVIVILSNNHLSNVKTIQSIFKQTHPEIYLAICNDAIPKFDCERFIYNLLEKSENIKCIYFKENRYPLGEFLSQQQFYNILDTQYVFTMHSGEYLIASNSLESLVNNITESNSAAVICDSELWSNDMRSKLKTNSVYNIVNNEILSQLKYTMSNDLRDCMLLYRSSVLRNLHFKYISNNSMAFEYIVPELIDNGHNIIYRDTAICKYSMESVKSVDIVENNLFSQEGLLSIREKLSQQPVPNKLEYVPINTAQLRKKKIVIKFYKKMHFKKVAQLIQINLLLIICGMLSFYLSNNSDIFKIIALTFWALSIIIFLIVLSIITYKAYLRIFKKVGI